MHYCQYQYLLKSFWSVIHFKLEYGYLIYGGARKFCPKLNTTYHQGLYLALGAYNTFLVESLYIESNEIPLTLHQQKLALQYYTKLHSKQHNLQMHILHTV